MEKEWKNVCGYEGYYQISNIGNVRSVGRFAYGQSRWLNPKKIKPQKTGKGYLSVTLRKDGGIYRAPVHRLVAIAFIHNPECKPEVNHKNGVRDDNRHTELEWCTGSENVRHALSIGLTTPANGMRHGMAKLSDDETNEIIQINKMYGLSPAKAAEEYNITRQRVWQIIHNYSR